MNFGKISGHLPVLPTFKNPDLTSKNPVFMRFAGFLPTFPLLILNYYDRKFKNI